MTRHYHYTDIASYGDVFAGFVPLPEEEREDMRYKANAWKVDPLVCRSYGSISATESVLLLQDPVTEELYLVQRASLSPELVIVVSDTPLMIDEVTATDTDAVGGFIIPNGTPESTLPKDMRKDPLPVSLLSEGALKACQKNGRYAFRMYEYQSVRTVSDYTEARAFFLALDNWRKTEQAQSLEAGRGDQPSTPGEDRLRRFLRSL